ncbi:MAG: DUF423 domain-containing protein [Steroidobacteraceae bacterium]
MSTARRLQGGGALLLAAGVVVGALGAHLLRARLAPDRFDVLQTAVLYQLVSGLGLLGVGLALERASSGARLLALGGRLLFAGALLFCGSLYLLLAGAPRWVGPLTPLGGACLIAGWTLVAVALLRREGR